MAKQTIILTESELREMIEASINEAMQDEGFFGNMWRGAKNAFGGDASRIGQGAKRMGQSVGNAARKVGQAVGNAAQKAGQAVQQGAQNVAQGAQKRYNAAKAGFQAGQYNDKLDNLEKLLTDLQSKGVLHGNKTNQAIQTLIYQIGMLRRGNNSAASAFKNAI